MVLCRIHLAGVEDLISEGLVLLDWDRERHLLLISSLVRVDLYHPKNEIVIVTVCLKKKTYHRVLLTLWMLTSGLGVALFLTGLRLAISTDVATHCATFSFEVSVLSLAVW